jgi:hypothetical protein
MNYRSTDSLGEPLTLAQIIYAGGYMKIGHSLQLRNSIQSGTQSRNQFTSSHPGFRNVAFSQVTVLKGKMVI